MLQKAFTFNSISSSYVIFTPLSINEGVVLTQWFLHKVKLDDKTNEILPIGNKIPFSDCSKIYNLQVIEVDKEKLILMSYRNYTLNAHTICLRKSTNLNEIVCQISLPGATVPNGLITCFYGTVFEEHFYFMGFKDMGVSFLID